MADPITFNTVMAESGGRLNARNPRSSATGPGQFIDSTWLSMVKKYRPDLASGLSDAQILALRTDEKLGMPLSVEMTARYGAENRDYLKSRGVEAGPGSTYLAHFAGPQGAASVLSNPNAPIERLLTPGAIAANPFLRGMTGQQVIDWAQRKEAGGGQSASSAMAANLRKRFSTGTAGGATKEAQSDPERIAGGAGADSLAGNSGMDRLKKALSGDLGRTMQEAGTAAAGKARNWGQGAAALLTAFGGGVLEGREGEIRKADDKAVVDALLTGSGGRDTIEALLGSSNPKYREAGVELLLKSQQPRPMETLAPGATIYDPNKREAVYTAPVAEKERTLTEIEKRADAAGLTGEERRKYILGGPPKTATEKWNEGQSKAANFGNMMVQAETLIGGFGPKDAAGKPQIGPDGRPVEAENPKGILGVVRDAIPMPEGVRNSMTSTEQQNYDQAAAQWIGAKLRKESGAAIGDEEMAKEFRTYFPQYGDGPEVIKQKAAAREEATRGMIAESAGAYEHFFGGKGGEAPAAAAPATPAGLPAPKSQAEFQALPSGARFIDPEGKERVKP